MNREKEATQVNLSQAHFVKGKKVRFYFVNQLNSSKEFYKDLQRLKAFYEERSTDPASPCVKVKLINVDECVQFEKKRLMAMRANVFIMFVFEHFEQTCIAFDHICKMENIYVFHNKIALQFMKEQVHVPTNSYHIHNFYLRDAWLGFAFTNEDQMTKYGKLAEFMGAQWSNSLYKSNTFLVTNNVLSEKYKNARFFKIPILHFKWLEDSWEISHANPLQKRDKSKDSKYTLAIFSSLEFTCTGLTNEEKVKAKAIIEKLGGKFAPNFNTHTTDILLMRENSKDSLKFKKAQEHNIDCVDPAWLVECQSTSNFISPSKYKYRSSRAEVKLKSSTPTKGENSQLNNFNFDSTAISAIGDHSASRHVIDESQEDFRRRRTTELCPKALRNPANKTSTSSRPSTLPSTSVTKSSNQDKSHTFKKPQLLKKACEVSDIQVPAPLQFNYSHDSETDASNMSVIQILAGKVVAVTGFENDTDSILCIKECEKNGASLVDLSYTKPIDFVIAPSQYLLREEPKLIYKYLLNDYWLEESIEEGRCILPPKFHHLALFKQAEKNHALAGETFSCSNYEDRERRAVKSLIENLGGKLKDSFCTSDFILLCDIPDGRKYEAAISWDKTILQADWLAECFMQKSRVDETNYLLGSTRPSKFNKKSTEIIDNIPSSQSAMEGSLHDSSPRLPSTPTTPTASEICGFDDVGGPILDISLLCQDVPTPSRELTKQILRENRRERNINMSPRALKLKELMKTPGTNGDQFFFEPSSPAPELPECMRPLPEGERFAPFPDASPYSQWWYKQKRGITDSHYVEISESKKKELKSICRTPTPMEIRRSFFKRRLPEFATPSPVAAANKTADVSIADVSDADMSKEAQRFLNFGDTDADIVSLKRKSTENETDDFLNELAKEASELSAKKKRLSYEKDYEAQQKSAQTVFQQSQDGDENVMMLDQEPCDDEVNWTSTQKEAPRAAATDTCASTASYYRASVRRRLSEFDECDEDGAAEMDARPIGMAYTESELLTLTDDKEKENENTKEMPVAFGISMGNSSAEVKAEIVEKIQKIGGELVETGFTHLIIPKLVRSSKFFSACASGSKVLHPDYLDECLKEKKFVETDEFEVGNPQFKCTFSGVRDDLLLNGPYLCRLQIERNYDKYPDGLFTGQRFLLFTSESRKPSIMDIIHAGGGTVVDNVTYSSAMLKRSNITMCLADKLELLDSKQKDALTASNIEIKSLKYLYDYLLKQAAV